MKFQKTFLVLKAKWYDLIKSLEKTSEFRDNTPYFRTRLLNKPITHIVFQKGYGKDKILAEVKEVKEIERNGRPTIEVVLGNIYNEAQYQEMELKDFEPLGGFS